MWGIQGVGDTNLVKLSESCAILYFVKWCFEMQGIPNSSEDKKDEII